LFGFHSAALPGVMIYDFREGQVPVSLTLIDFWVDEFTATIFALGSVVWVVMGFGV